MKELFEIAVGSVTGRDHKLINKNNQDANYVSMDEEMIIGIVCDGCSEGKHSEVGAKIGARLIAEEIKKTAAKFDQINFEKFLENVRKNVLARIRCLIIDMGESFSRTINHYFLFTVVGFILTKKDFALFSIGDGFIQINDETINLGPFPDNEPPYLAYALLDSSLVKKDPEQLKFNLSVVTNQEQIDLIIIGSDGIEDLIKAEYKNVPGKMDAVGSLEQFVVEDRFFKNKDMLRRRLTLVNKDSIKYVRDVRGNLVKVEKENGLLKDDTTVIALRRRW